VTDWVGGYEPPQAPAIYCGKRGYASETAANAAVIHRKPYRRYKDHGKRRKPHESNVYRCFKCGQWHTTSMEW
jgi:hypothetical protein